MIIRWPFFFPAVLLLLAPAGLCYGKRVKYRSVRRNWTRYWRRVLFFPWHTVDLIRAAIGGGLLLHGLTQTPNPHGLARYAVLLTEAFVLALATAVQSVACLEPDTALAPFAFSVGLVLSIATPLATVIALTTAVVFALGTRIAATFFPVLAVVVLGAGVVFARELQFQHGALAVALLLPYLLHLLFPRRWAVPYATTSRVVGHDRDSEVRGF